MSLDEHERFPILRRDMRPGTAAESRPRRATPSAIVAVTLVAAAAASSAIAQPQIVNGQVAGRDGSTLQPAFRSAAAAQGEVGWIGYAVPAVEGERQMCCVNSAGWSGGTVVARSGAMCCAMCGLEPPGAGTTAAAGPQQPTGPIKLEGSRQIVVLFRIVNREVERVRVFSEDCPLDAGGRTVAWLTGVKPVESVALLESVIAGQTPARDRITDGALTAIALHDEPAADTALERLVAGSQPQSIRTRVPFWLGQARGRRGLDLLQRVIRTDPSIDVRKKAAFGIAHSREGNAIDLLIDHARAHPDAAVRGDAIFWLAQKAGSRAAPAITERVEQDPDTDVKKRAVFALSQLPKDEAIPRLIQVARTHSNPAVRKQAIFWLGQSKDPRALDFFAEILR